jgi:hypothetical protein
MPEMQPIDPAATGLPSVAVTVPAEADHADDYALGCECADPALQIDWWRAEAQPPLQLG